MKKIIITIILLLFSALFDLAPANVFAWDITADFEQGTVGQEAQGTSGFSDAFSQTLYSNEQAYTGTQSAKVGFTQGTDAWAISGGSVINISFPNW